MVSTLRIRNPKYGWIPDLPDKRDFLYQSISPITKPLPGSIDLREKCSPIENQGNLGSCTACAVTGNMEFLERSCNLADYFYITTKE